MLTEAMIHMIGCHPCWPESWTPRARLEKRGECTGVLITIQRKANELRRRSELLDRELLLNTMTAGESQELDITTYPETCLVTQFYRDAIANMLNVIKIEDEDGNEIPDPLRLDTVYRRLLRGGDAFLPIREVFKKFDSLHMPYDHTEVIEDLQRLKDYASGAVKEVCENRLMLNDVEASGVDHLTYATVTMDVMPWVMARDALAAAQQQAEMDSAASLRQTARLG